MSIAKTMIFSLLLSSLVVTSNSLSAVINSGSCSHDISSQILAGLRLGSNPIDVSQILADLKFPVDVGIAASHPTSTSSVTSTSLNLETDFYDPSTGLHSEGVWHNALVGIASLEELQQKKSRESSIKASSESKSKTEAAQKYIHQIANSLYEFSWDGISFRRRSWSGNWDHSSLKDNASKPPEQANYYRESSEHRCVQHGMALIFWSKLILNGECMIDSTSSSLKMTRRYKEQEKCIADQFVKEFWCHDAKTTKWSTLSQSQGGGDTSRLSASAAKPTDGIDEECAGMPYYRAVDQAVAVLACLEHLQVLQQQQSSSVQQKDVKLFTSIIEKTCQQILSPIRDQGFGYGDIQDAKTYLGLNRNRNFWHDGWTFLALIKARQFIWPLDTNHGEAQLVVMWENLVGMYGCTTISPDEDGVSSHDENAKAAMDGIFWHWPRALKSDSYNVRYCGDNALAFAIRRNLSIMSNTSTIIDGGKGGDSDFFRFISNLRERDDENRRLVSVADIYPQVRLHPNTELAALLVWPS
mmetsp:Transcript_27875/g.32518  ORF Transcript_27875/g.32518 Transcript_27875/m.32518 type:complete len:527 (+) Transcript_27875:128-1708(+)